MPVRKVINRKTESGFTLVELMIVVVIIGILASVAIPQFNKFQLRSKHAEAGAVILGIAKAEDGLGGKFGNYGSALQQPPTFPLNGGKVAWVIANAAQGFGLIGYAPTGRTMFQYEAVGGAALPAVIAFDGTAVDVVLGADAAGYPCLGAAPCLASAGFVAARLATVDMLYVGQGNIDGLPVAATPDCFYGATDENYEARPSPATCGETTF